jgi:hypothetical protein
MSFPLPNSFGSCRINHDVLQLKGALEPMGKLRPDWKKSIAQCPDLEVCLQV